MLSTIERVPFSAVCDNIQSNFWATLGLENGVQEQTEDALDIVREVTADLPDMEGVAIVPVGSRVKGYAKLSSDLDLAIVCYDENVVPFRTRKALGKVITEQLGIKTCEPNFPSGADEALTISLIDYGHAASFSPQDIPFALSPTIFEGENVAELRSVVLQKWMGKGEIHLDFAERAYNRFLINPKFSYEGVTTRYYYIAHVPEASNPGYQEIEASFEKAYAERLHNFGGSILDKISQQ